VTALLDSNQYVVGRYLYDPFGRQLGKWGTMAEVNKYRFASKEFDYRAGLYYFGRRFYDPGLQRWLNRDPIQEYGGINLYGFIDNNPISFVDSLGLIKDWPDNWHHNALQDFEGEFLLNSIDINNPKWGTILPLGVHQELHTRDFNGAVIDFLYPHGGDFKPTDPAVFERRFQNWLNDIKSSDEFGDLFSKGRQPTVSYGQWSRGIKVLGAIGFVGAVISIPADAETIYGEVMMYKQDLHQGTPDGDAWAYADLLNMRATLNEAAPLAGDVAMRGFLALQDNRCSGSNGSMLQRILNWLKG